MSINKEEQKFILIFRLPAPRKGIESLLRTTFPAGLNTTSRKAMEGDEAFYRKVYLSTRADLADERDEAASEGLKQNWRSE